YDRYHGDSDPLHQWPDEYRPFVRPAVPHDQVASVYKRSRLALNINTVTESRTMFARRVFELMSSNTLVLSNHSLGMEEMFGEDVIFCDRDRDLDRLKSLDSAGNDEIRARNLNRVLRMHTYRNRWESILRVIGLPFQPAAEALTVVWPLRSTAQADRALVWFQQEADLTRDRLLLFAMEDMAPLEVAGLYESHNCFGVTVTSLA
ncbi:glycosyltransferase, partial [Pseudonocardia halophobica]|uniref:glycosyltransferase family protein n=1 Tax=Pseudonocardia halophobica TaxID=29401 RepID=UPI0022F30DC4